MPRLIQIAIVCFLLGGVATALIVDQFVGAQQAQLPGSSGPLAAPNRSHLSVCVDGAGGATVSATQLGLVRQALAAIRASPSNWPQFGEPEAVEGCPPSTTLSGPAPRNAVERHDALERARELWPPATANPHRVFVYWTAADTFAAYFGNVPYEVASEELLCSGHVCAGGTTGLYLTPSAAADTIQEGLLDALGLLPPEPQPTPNWTACALGTPEPWCARYQEFFGPTPVP